MYKIKKTCIFIITLIYIVLTIIEVIKYLKIDASIFGLYYLLLSTIILFLLIPCAYNYKKYFSKIRISKLIIIILLGILCSFFLQMIIFGSIIYNDNSNQYIKSIFLIKNIFKPILYFILTVFTIFEFKLDKLIK